MARSPHLSGLGSLGNPTVGRGTPAKRLAGNGASQVEGLRRPPGPQAPRPCVPGLWVCEPPCASGCECVCPCACVRAWTPSHRVKGALELWVLPGGR